MKKFAIQKLKPLEAEIYISQAYDIASCCVQIETYLLIRKPRKRNRTLRTGSQQPWFLNHCTTLVSIQVKSQSQVQDMRRGMKLWYVAE